MDWQKQFDERFTQCAVVADKIFPITAEFEKLEAEHGLFTDVLRASAETENLAKKHRMIKWQYYIGFPIFFGVIGAFIGLVIYNGVNIAEVFDLSTEWVMPDSTMILVFPGVIGFVIGLFFGLWLNSGEGISKVMHLETDEMHRHAKDKLIKGLNSSQKLQKAIIETQYDLITQQDELINGEWTQALASLMEMLDKAPSNKELANNASKISDMKKMDETFISLTKQVLVSQERERAKQEDIERSMKLIGGVLAVAGIAAIGFTVFARHSMKDFGNYSSPSGDRWINKETGEVFDYDPR